MRLHVLRAAIVVLACLPRNASAQEVKIDHYGSARDGISVATLAEIGFAYMKMYGATKINADSSTSATVASSSTPRP
ncbi:MAG: hypothetical protein HYS05_04835 [Acidobacteria bacterium]|nr:hypothetical protein [Acidobacteriota bacterium]